MNIIRSVNDRFYIQLYMNLYLIDYLLTINLVKNCFVNTSITYWEQNQ